MAITDVISEITLEVNGTTNTYSTLIAKQGDNRTRWIDASITNNGEPLTIPQDCKVFINFKRGDQKGKSYEGEILEDGAKARFPLPFWALELPYTVRCDVSILDVSALENLDPGEEIPRLTTLDFFIKVQAAAVSDSDIEGDDTTGYLLTLIQQVEALAQDFKGYYINDSVTTEVEVTLKDRTQYCYTAGVTKFVAKVNSDAGQGWCSDISLTIGESPVNIEFQNFTEYPTKLVRYTETDSYIAPAGSTVVIYCTITGANLICTIQEFSGQ